MTGERSVGECDKLSNEVADNCDGKKLRILRNGTLAIDGFKIMSQLQSLKLC